MNFDWNKSGGMDLGDDVLNSSILKEMRSDKGQGSKNDEEEKYDISSWGLGFSFISGLLYQVVFYFVTGMDWWRISLFVWIVLWVVLSFITYCAIRFCTKIKRQKKEQASGDEPR